MTISAVTYINRFALPVSPDDLTQLLSDLPTTQAVFAHLRQRLAQTGVWLRDPPAEPTTCCGRGCNGCVWEGFYAAANYWRDDAVEALERFNSELSPEQ